MATLREIDADLQALEDLLFSIGGDISDEDADVIIDHWFAELGDARDKKLDGYATLIRSLEGRAKLRTEEADRLYHLAKLDTGGAKRLKDRLRWWMDSHVLHRVQTKLHRFTLGLAGGKQALTLTVPDAEIPEGYAIYQTIRVIDKERIRWELEDGRTLPFARLEERGKTILIR